MELKACNQGACYRTLHLVPCITDSCAAKHLAAQNRARLGQAHVEPLCAMTCNLRLGQAAAC